MSISSLAGQYISASFQPLIQYSSSGAMYDGLGNQITKIVATSLTGSVQGTASFAVSAAYAPGTSTAGSDTHVQYNKSGSLGGSTAFKFDYGRNSLNVGYSVNASGQYAIAIGANTVASGLYSKASGNASKATGDYSNAEGNNTLASGTNSHAEGMHTSASGDYSHAEGYYTAAKGFASHAEGELCVASGSYSHAEGYKSYTYGIASKAIGYGAVAYHPTEFVLGGADPVYTSPGTKQKSNMLMHVYTTDVDTERLSFGDLSNSYQGYTPTINSSYLIKCDIIAFDSSNARSKSFETKHTFKTNGSNTITKVGSGTITVLDTDTGMTNATVDVVADNTNHVIGINAIVSTAYSGRIDWTAHVTIIKTS